MLVWGCLGSDAIGGTFVLIGLITSENNFGSCWPPAPKFAVHQDVLSVGCRKMASNTWPSWVLGASLANPQ